MNARSRICILLLLALSLPQPTFAADRCRAYPHSQVQENQAGPLTSGHPEKFDEKTTDSVDRGSSKRGYIVLVGVMVSTAVATTALSTNLPPGLQFASVFIAQASTLGVYVLGAPIWRPMSSKLNRWAYTVIKGESVARQTSGRLESLHEETNRVYGLEAQMSRNILGTTTFFLKESSFRAYDAFVNGNPLYAADQLAEAAYRLQILYKEVKADDPSGSAAVVTAFTNHVELNDDFRALVWERLRRLDSNEAEPETNRFYRDLFAIWLASDSVRDEREL